MSGEASLRNHLGKSAKLSVIYMESRTYGLRSSTFVFSLGFYASFCSRLGLGFSALWICALRLQGFRVSLWL